MKIPAFTRSSQVAFVWHRLVKGLSSSSAEVEKAEALGKSAEEAMPSLSARRSCVLTCVAAALVAIWLTLGALHEGNSSDSFIPTFVSLYRWKWFYWTQNRYGMLTALLAMPVRHPLMNLLFQNWMVAFSGLMVFPLSSAYLLGWRNAPLAGIVAAGVLLLAGPWRYHADYFIIQPYAVSTFLALVGLLVMDSDGDGTFRSIRTPLCVTLHFLAQWVSLAAAFVILPLFVLHWFLVRKREGGDRRRFVTGLLMVMVPALANWQIAVRHPGGGDFGWTAPQSWPGSWAALLQNAYERAPAAFLTALVTLLAAGAATSMLSAAPLRRQRSVRAFAAAVLAAFSYLVVLAATQHVRASGFPFRYILVSIVLIVSAIGFLATSSIADALKPRWHRALQGALLVGLVIGVTLRYGAPSYARVRGMMDRRYGHLTSAVLEMGCTHILGDYWEVWGAVLHANTTQYESGRKQVIWSLTGRSQDTRDLWLPLLNGGLVAVPRSSKSDEEWAKQAKSLKLPDLNPIRETPSVRVYSTSRRAADGALVGGPGQVRTYGSSDMQIRKCMRVERDGTIVGENCPPGALVFGPYVPIPKGATVRVIFEFQAEGDVKLVSDVVSSGGRVFHGATEEQKIDARTTQSVGYRVRMFDDTDAAEARIKVSSAGNVSFKITKFSLVVL